MRIAGHLLSRSVFSLNSVQLTQVKNCCISPCCIVGRCAVRRKNAAVWHQRAARLRSSTALWTSAFTHVVSFTCRQSDKTCRCLLRSFAWALELGAGCNDRLCSLPGIQPASPHDTMYVVYSITVSRQIVARSFNVAVAQCRPSAQDSSVWRTAVRRAYT